MHKYQSISDLVHSHVNFIYGTNSKGWSRCYCEVCGDGRRIKGPRGGWIFDGDMGFYHCFNCGVGGNFDPHREYPFSKDMRDILDKFGIPTKEYLSIAYPIKESSGDFKKPEFKAMATQYYEIPNHFYPLEGTGLDNAVAGEAKRFLRDNYALSHQCYPFYLSTGKYVGTDPSQIAVARKLVNRLIIPYFRHGKMIYYQARALGDQVPKYLNMSVPKTNVIFNMDALYKNMERPLYVFEGVFDALHVDGVAVMENNLTSNQIDILNKSPRPKVIVPDRHGDSNKLVEIGVLEQGWGIALPEIGSTNKDLCEGIVKYGKLHVINSMVKRTYYGQQAKAMATFL